MKFFRVLCVLAIALCLTASVYAETQSVKVSGDLTVRGIYRSSYALQSSPQEAVTAGTIGNLDSNVQSWLMSVAAIQVDADLTDNVSTVIRILNQRDWNVYGKSINSATSLTPNGRGIYGANNDEFNVMLDLAYLTLKDFIYSPLTLTIGRQNLWFGKGFIVGLNQQNPGAGVAAPNLLIPGNLSAPEYTGINSFDAVKAVLDYDPWTVTAMYAKIFEDAIQARDDVNLWGVNVGYKFDQYKAEAEGYWFYKQDRSIPTWNDLMKTSNDVHTFGLRGSFDPVDVVTIAAEGAVQGGEYVGTQLQQGSRPRAAWAFDLSGEFRYFADKISWKPKLGAEWVYYSGEEPQSNFAVQDGPYNGWNPMFRGKFDSAIREFVGRFYQTVRYPARPRGTPSSPDASFTNQNQVIFSGSVQPTDSLTLKANYNLFWNIERYESNNGVVDSSKTQGFLGQEVDLQANWDYTEDVSFNLLAGWFIPGDVYNAIDNKASTATDLVGTVKVSF